MVISRFPSLGLESPFPFKFIFSGIAFVIFSKCTFKTADVGHNLFSLLLTWIGFKLVIVSYSKCSIKQ